MLFSFAYVKVIIKLKPLKPKAKFVLDCRVDNSLSYCLYLFCSPAVRGVVEVKPETGDNTSTIEQKPGKNQKSSPLPAAAAKYQEDVNQD